MTWRRKRQLLIALFVLGPVILALGLWWFLSRPAPSCFDRIQNQDEEGVDCGGICGNICQDNVPNPAVEWARTFNVSGDAYNAVTEIRVPEGRVYAEDVPYRFSLFDSEGVLVAEKEGRADIPPTRTIAIFEPAISVGNRIPTRATFEFKERVQWEEAPVQNAIEITQQNVRVQNTDTGTRITVEVVQQSGENLSNVSLALVAFNNQGNAIHASQTFLEELTSDTSTSVTFTWPSQFAADVDTVSLLPVSFNVQ